MRRRNERQAGRDVWIGDCVGGVSEIHGCLFTPDAHALAKRLDALAAPVCEHNPRTKDQRRADALGALAAGADRLGCRCGRPDCCAGGKAAGPVVIHVIAEQPTVNGTGQTTGSMVEVDGLIRPNLLQSSRSRPSWCRSSIPVMRRASAATPRRGHWPTSCGAGI